MQWKNCFQLSGMVAILFVLAAGGNALAQQAHQVHHPAEIVWKEAPPSLPRGAQAAVLRGDPTQPGLFTMRLKFPPGYVVMPHWHTADEHVTVITGALLLGIGENYDAEKVERILPGSLMVMPATHRHYARFDQETVLQLHGMGPWVVNYVRPADDPRNR